MIGYLGLEGISSENMITQTISTGLRQSLSTKNDALSSLNHYTCWATFGSVVMWRQFFYIFSKNHEVHNIYLSLIELYCEFMIWILRKSKQLMLWFSCKPSMKPSKMASLCIINIKHFLKVLRCTCFYLIYGLLKKWKNEFQINYKKGSIYMLFFFWDNLSLTKNTCLNIKKTRASTQVFNLNICRTLNPIDLWCFAEVNIWVLSIYSHLIIYCVCLFVNLISYYK